MFEMKSTVELDKFTESIIKNIEKYNTDVQGGIARSNAMEELDKNKKTGIFSGKIRYPI